MSAALDMTPRRGVSTEAEQAVLGALMLDNPALDDIADRVSAEDFADAGHRRLFAAIQALQSAGRPFDAVTLGEYLEGRGELEQAGGIGYVAGLAYDAPGSTNIRAYADVVADRSRWRQARAAVAGMSRAVDAANDGAAAAGEVMRLAGELERGERGDGPKPIGDFLLSVVEDIDRRFHAGGGLLGESTGLDDLDAATGGLCDGRLYTVAGRPGMGKSALAFQIAASMAGRDLPVLAFSFEMPAQELSRRVLASLGRLDSRRLQLGDLQEEDWGRLTSAVAQTQHLPLHIAEQSGIHIRELCAQARRLHRKVGLRLIVVDYVQQVQGDGENETQRIEHVSRSLKQLAMELNCPVIGVAQLNRAVESRHNKRPMMSDLRGSGGLEQDSDVIVFIYREEIYNPDTNRKGIAEVIIGKNRNGPAGVTVPLTFLGQYTRFEGFAGQMPEDDHVSDSVRGFV